MKFSFLSLLTSFGPLPAVPPPSLTTPAPTATGIEGPAHHNIETWDPAYPPAQECLRMWMPETATPTPSFTTRPIEPALLQCEQQLPPLAIGIACFMAGCAVTAIATRYGLVCVGKAAAAVQQVPVIKDSDATEVVADEANDVAAAAVQQAPVIEDSDATEVVADEVVADEDEANDVAAAAVQQAPVVENNSAAEVVAASDVGTVGEVETDNMAAAVVQQAPVVDDNDVKNEQPTPWRRTHRGKRAGVRERARAGRRLERLSAAAGQQSDEDQVPTSAFNSNNRRNQRRNNQTNKQK
ncbi:hypothetical protein GGI09_007865 [Coemansia sp. S100]|nr:hypothetical protein LPJ71_006331 [Coemansia sp. S17]KAJ2079714.1 hypothetical protein GGI09_007865 [Coemansia sp. S100]KAJ2087885.1 hypothetical protein GGI16_006405 [Coemansia sp. S142-1]